jgi:LysM repeat protein
VVLALPLRALGGVTVTGQQTPGGLPAGLIPGEPYTVRAGDSLASIASRLGAPSAQAQLVRELRQEVGSSVVVPGEQITLP